MFDNDSNHIPMNSGFKGETRILSLMKVGSSAHRIRHRVAILVKSDDVLALTAGVLAFDLVVKSVPLRKTSAWKSLFELLSFWRWFGLN